MKAIKTIFRNISSVHKKEIPELKILDKCNGFADFFAAFDQHKNSWIKVESKPRN